MSVWQRIRSRFRRIGAAFTPSEVAWRGASLWLWLLAGLIMLGIFATEVVPDFSLGKLIAFVVLIVAMLLAGLLIRLALWLFLLLPRSYRASLLLLVPLLVLALAPGAGEQGAAVVVVSLLLITAMLGGTVAVLRRDGWKPRSQKVTLTTLAIGVALLITGLWILLGPSESPNPALADFQLEDRTLAVADPGQTGDYAVKTLTYGSGKDTHRPEYGVSVDLVSRSVDGSKLVDNWEGPGGWLRTRYWGFDATELPLQGRVWYPEGDGPFPLVLIVHGNHKMEDYSDPGYAYLGELLASRGYIFVSVDENFLNSSIADMADLQNPGLDEENDARGWLLLEHLSQWSDWNKAVENPFTDKVDLDRVALIGHSRGGEAVAVAAAFNRLDRYPDDATLAFDYGYNIRGIIAIAPSDGQYKPRGRGTPLRDISYFAIHGSLDGDVTTFMGSSQYSRIVLTPKPPGGEFHFKSSLYVLGANHGQFNTLWGRNDLSGFFGWSLDTRAIMDPDDQRRIATTFFSAFLDVVLRENRAYLPIFRDARRSAAWIPNTFYVQNYADSRDLVLADFEEDLNPSTTTFTGGQIEGERLTKWHEQWISLKFDPLDTHVAVVAWDRRAETDPAVLRIRVPAASQQVGEDARLVFSLAAVDEETLPKDWDGDDESQQDTETPDTDEPEPLDWTIIVSDSAGELASLPLSHDRLLYPPIVGPTRRASFLERGELSESVFHRYEFRLEDFRQANPRFDATAIQELRFVFDASPKGAIAIDNVGFADDKP